MKKFIKFIIVILGIVLLFLLIRYNLSTGMNFSANDKLLIYDDDSKIALDYDSYSYLSERGENKKNTTNIKFNFTGMDTRWKIEAEKDAVLTIDYDSKISKGDFKVVIISPQKEVSTILDQSASGSKDINIKKGTSRIKIVGKNAKGKLKLKLKYSKDVKPISIDS